MQAKQTPKYQEINVKKKSEKQADNADTQHWTANKNGARLCDGKLRPSYLVDWVLHCQAGHDKSEHDDQLTADKTWVYLLK